jgi:hemerythrin superfamily protein
MKATDLLEMQHRDVEALFERVEKSRNEDEKGDLFEDLAHSLVAHDAIERELFYPACEKKMGMTDLLGEALVEHGVVEFSLYLADEAQGYDDFDPKITVLKEVVSHHVKEEEQEFFPRVEKALGAELLAKLGEEMEARFEEVKAGDFRGPLHENLRQVLDGATETVPESSKKKRTAKKTAAKRAARAAH